MRGTFHSLWIIIYTAVLAGCSAHSFPLTNRFIYADSAACAKLQPCVGKDAAAVFADVNGTLFPSGWQEYLQPKMRKNRPGEARWPAGSLLAAAPAKSAFRNLIVRDEVRQYAEIQAFGQRHDRIFILVHGYNASVVDTDVPFTAIESQLDLKPGDGIIRFYWDSLIGNGAGVIPTWLQASEASQVVGARALRSTLNQFEGRKIYIISHSRGASVVLSALGNPVYKPKFLAKMRTRIASWGKGYKLALNPTALADRGNAFHLVMLAPAVDRIDFCDAREQPNMGKNFVCPKLRPLGAQVKSMVYTVNPDDPVLGKFFLPSKALTPTGLGYVADVGAALKQENYGILRAYTVEKPASFHAFEAYVAHPVFGQILRDAGIAKTGP